MDIPRVQVLRQRTTVCDQLRGRFQRSARATEETRLIRRASTALWLWYKFFSSAVRRQFQLRVFFKRLIDRSSDYWRPFCRLVARYSLPATNTAQLGVRGIQPLRLRTYNHTHDCHYYRQCICDSGKGKICDEGLNPFQRKTETILRCEWDAREMIEVALPTQSERPTIASGSLLILVGQFL